MVLMHLLTLYDIQSIIIMLVFALLSKKLGEALKIPPLYKILYATALVTAIASILDIMSVSYNLKTMSLVSMALRFIGSAGAFFITLRYWKWLFSEFLRK